MWAASSVWGGGEKAPPKGMKLQFSGEIFNLTNSPQFGKPVTTLQNPTFGTVTSLARGGTANTRIVQLGLKFLF